MMAEDMEVQSPPSPPNEPESPPTPHEPSSSLLFGEYPPEERIHSDNHPDSTIAAALQTGKLWKRFAAIGTEMIVTRRGRRMFPPLKVELFDLEPNTYYVLLMDMAPVDKYRYKYQNSAWVKCFEEECSPTRLYIHPDSPALGSHWMNTIINFYKLKLTNNQLDKQGHIIVNSMHCYQPRLHIVESNDINNLNWERFHTFIFPGTQFTTVTAYQNDKITQLKIENNPFAKGFRSPFSRCRARNHGFPLRSNSDSGTDDSRSPPNMLSSHILLPPNPLQEQLAAVRHNLKRKSEGGCDIHSPKQICLAGAAAEHGQVKIIAPQAITNSHPNPTPQSPVPNGTPIFIIYKPLVQADNPSLKSAAPTLLQPNGATLLQTSNGHGATFIQAQTLGGDPAAATLVQPTTVSLNNPTVIQASPGVFNGTTVIQANGQPLPIVHTTSRQQILNNPTVIQANPGVFNGTTVIQANGQPLPIVQHIRQPQVVMSQSTTTSAPVITEASVGKNAMAPQAMAKNAIPVIDIRNLTKEGNPGPKTPPPLLQFATTNGEAKKQPTPPRTVSPIQILSSESQNPSVITAQGVAIQNPTASSIQRFFIVAEKADAPATMLVQAQNAADIGALNSRPQALLPMPYDQQQIVTTMPIYRFNSMNTLQPIQILTPIGERNATTA